MKDAMCIHSSVTTGRDAPTESRGRSESPLAAPAGAEPFGIDLDEVRNLMTEMDEMTAILRGWKRPGKKDRAKAANLMTGAIIAMHEMRRELLMIARQEEARKETEDHGGSDHHPDAGAGVQAGGPEL